MSDNLRDRIAAIIYTSIPYVDMEHSDKAADAVIEALKLKQESASLVGDGPIVRRLDGTVLSNHKPAHRYVTEWTNDE